MKLQIALKRSDYMFGGSYYVPIGKAHMSETFCPHDGDNDYTHFYERTNRYELVTVDAPEGVTDYEYAANQEQYMHLMMNFPTVTAEQARKLVKLSREERIVCIDLLKVKAFRSDFRKSLRTQLDAWLAGANAYLSPFSAAQWQSQWAAAAYRRRAY